MCRRVGMNDEWFLEDEASTSLHNKFAWCQIQIFPKAIVLMSCKFSKRGSDSSKECGQEDVCTQTRANSFSVEKRSAWAFH